MPSSSFAAAAIAAMVASPTLATAATAAGLDMPWFANAGVAGMCGFLLWWHIERGDKRTAEAVKDVKAEISGMRADLKDGQDTTNDLLTKALFPNGGPK